MLSFRGFKLRISMRACTTSIRKLDVFGLYLCGFI